LTKEIDEFLSPNMSVVDYEEVEALRREGLVFTCDARSVKLLSDRKSRDGLFFCGICGRERNWKKD
jgi:hypothetical protein